MSVLGQLQGLAGHLSPVAGYEPGSDMVLLMDVWWETRPVWVNTGDLWTSMNTTDHDSGKKVDNDLGDNFITRIVLFSERICGYIIFI